MNHWKNNTEIFETTLMKLT